MYLDAKEVIEEVKYRSRKNTHVVTPRQIAEATIDNNIAMEDTEQARVLIDSLSVEKGKTKSH